MNNKKKIKNIALCGGGFFGYAEVGAISELENYKDHFEIKSIRGVSVGSMIAALYAVGYTPQELKEILFNINFDLLIKDTMLPYLSLYDKYGMYKADKLQEEVESLIRKKTNIKFCTFSQVEKDLTVIATNLNYQCPKFFNKENTPDMVVSLAVRMSIGYPGIITPILYENDLYGDGGESMNYPIITYENLDETLGITFAAHNENPDGTLKNRIPINNIYDYIRSLALTMTRSTYVSQITQKYLDRSIVVHITEDINSMQFNLNNDQKKFIFDCGVKAVNDQIKKIIGE